MLFNRLQLALASRIPHTHLFANSTPVGKSENHEHRGGMSLTCRGAVAALPRPTPPCPPFLMLPLSSSLSAAKFSSSSLFI